MCYSIRVISDLTRYKEIFGAEINQKAFDYLRAQQSEEPKKFIFAPDTDGRVFPKLWAPVVVEHQGERQIRPMRYQLVPYFSKTERYTRKNPKTGKAQEIAGTYNARVESLLTAKAWQRPFQSQHGVLLLSHFYEWVEKDGKKALIKFHPTKSPHIIAPCLWDTWYSEDRETIIQSFAIITRSPNPEVLKMGHDRTPVNLRISDVQAWLNPKEDSAQIINRLSSISSEYYEFEWE